MSQVDIPGLPLNTTPPSDSLFEISNSGVSESTRLEDIVFGLQETSEKDQLNGYAGLDGVGQISLSAVPDLSATYQVIIDKDQNNGYAGLDGSGLLKLSAYPAGNALEFLRRNAANTALEFAATGSVSPVTTKGDIFGFDTANARIPVGTDGQVLTANSAQALGVEYTTIVFPSDTPWTVDHDAAGFNLINVTQFETNATNPAGSGAIRLGDTESIAWRNSGNDGDQTIISDDVNLSFNGWEEIDFPDASEVFMTGTDLQVEDITMQGGDIQMEEGNIGNAASIESGSEIGTSFATEGEFRMPNTGDIGWRNFADSDNIFLLVNVSDEFEFNSALNLLNNDLKNVGDINTDGFMDMAEISTPANPATDVGRLYTKDVSSITHLFFRDSVGTETDLLASVSPLTTKGDLFTYDTGNQRLAVGADTFVLTADSAEATGIKWAAAAVASQTPWLADIDADGFDLQDLSNIEFRNTTGSPAGSQVAIYEVSDDLRLNAASGDFVSLGTDGDQIVRVTDGELQLPSGGDITGVSSYKFGANISHEITADASSIFIDGVTDVRINVSNTLEYLFSATAANFQGNNLTNLSLTTSVTVANSLTWADGIRQTFNPNATNSGINVGAHTAEPSTPTDGDLFYDSTALAMKARINGVWIQVGAGGGAANQIIQLNTSVTVTDSGSDGLADFVIDGSSLMILDVDGLQLSSAIQEAQGTDTLISSNKFTFPRDGNYFESGSTNGTVDHIDNVGWQIGSVVSFRFNTFSTNDLIHDETPSGSSIPLFLIDATDVVDSDQTTIYTFRYDGTYWRELARNTLGGGAPQTPWLSDIFAAGFDLTDLSNLEFQNTTGAPAGTKPSIYHDPGGMNLNVAAATVISLLVGGTDEYSFSSFVADFKSNDIIGVTDLTLAGNVIFPDGVRQTFNPNATNSGLNVGTQSDPDPTSPLNGDIYYNTTNNKFRAREGGAWFDMIGGTGDIVGPGSSTDEAIVRFDGTSGQLAQDSTVTIDDDGDTVFPRSVQWSASATLPTAGIIYMQHTTSALRANVPTGSTFVWTIQGASEMNLSPTGINFQDKNLTVGTGYIDLEEIATPLDPVANVGRLYTKDVAAVTTLFFLDSAGTETDLLAGGSQTPWLSDIEAATFDLNNLGNLNFALTGATGIPAITEPFITWDDTLTPDAMRFNVPTGQEYSFYVNGVEEYHFSSTVMDFHFNQINNVAFIELESATLPVLRFNRTSGAVGLGNAGEIEFRSGNQIYGEIICDPTDVGGGDETGTLRLRVAANSFEYDMITLTGSTGGPNFATISFNGRSMASQIDMNGNVIQNISDFRSDATNIAAAGFMRAGNNDILAWRNNANSQDHSIVFNASDQFVIVINGGTDYTFDDNVFDMINNSIEQLLRIQDSTQNEQLVFAAGVASAVNYLHITNAATGTGPIFAALGDDSNVDLRIRQKGDASIIFADDDGFEELLVLTQVSGAAQNYVEITNALTAVGPTIAAQGQADVDLNIASKGTGVINLLDIVVIPDQVTLQVGTFTDAQRPAAGTTGRVIFNTDDGQLNIDDGTNWTLPDGTTT